MARILIADDDPMIRRLLEVTLVAAGHTVTLAEDGREALELLAQELPDIFLLDEMMPYLTGTEVLQVLNTNGVIKNLPVVLMTARSQSEDVAEGLALGASEYVAKPFSPKDMVAVVNRLTSAIPA
ncbi:MAG: response regulator [Alphaproteobacteria bacterium]|jgi:DNA-binding response OmpR family regulator|nr:response regulator [Alphaproteobacteria bacterium]MBT4020465.1 response regulator [Alphaproteobacteria bacterium]MBT4964974.1 response regulator [Alphaproteobacteria bacterium]MBT5161249.1 response regulator [Alphaproteobacteria bacterium]MBT5918185.1 response regulator [Alphaproteobacteria bacterium]